jgi:plasmid stability protein
MKTFEVRGYCAEAKILPRRAARCLARLRRPLAAPWMPQYDGINDQMRGEAMMATKLIVHDVDDDIARALYLRAADHGRSVEEEHREILKQALQRPQRRPLADVLASMPNVGDDADFDVRKK